MKKLRTALMLSLIGLALYMLVGSPAWSVNLVRNGRAVASIVIPAQPLDVESYAAQELQYHVKASTGAELSIVREGGDVPSGAHVYLGNCAAAKKAGVDPSGLPGNGYQVKTVGRDLFIAGKDSEGDPIGQQQRTAGVRVRTDAFEVHAGTLFGVYELLETKMGVHWLWPGKLGEFIPKTQTISVTMADASVDPLLWFKDWRTGLANQTGGDDVIGNVNDYTSRAKYDKYAQDEIIWLRRQRFGRSTRPQYGHSFVGWWERYGTAHPDYFAMLPTGTRGMESNGKPQSRQIHMCVSNPALWKQIIDNWQAAGKGEYINICENDWTFACTCPTCLSWDISDPTDKINFANRLQNAKADYPKDKWVDDLGSLSTRYAKYAESVRQEASKIRTDVKVIMYAYDNYRKPPIGIKLTSNDLIGEVPSGIFPYNKKRSVEFRNDWEGWSSTGCSLFWRPNFTLQGHDFPVFYARTVGADLQFAAHHSLKGVDFDSLTGQWSTQGPSLYMIAKMLNYPDSNVEGVVDEYCAAFGPAKDAVKDYFNFWESISSRDDVDEAWMGFLVNPAPKMYTSDVMSKGRSLIGKARSLVQNDNSGAKERVEWLAKGLEHVDLTLKAQNAFVAGKKSGDMSAFNTAKQQLSEFRKANEDLELCNYSGLTGMEQGVFWATKQGR